MVDSRMLGNEIDRTMTIGRDNAIVHRDVEGWCEHLVVAIEGISPLGQMAGLPIGMHNLSCRYAEYSTGGIGLRDVFEGYLIEHCMGCSEHKPGTRPELGKACLEAAHRRMTEAREMENARCAVVESKRSELLQMAERYAASSRPQSASLYRLVSELFATSDNHSSEMLLETCEVAPDLFEDKIIEILMWGASDNAFADKCLPVLARLSSKNEAVREKVRPTVINCSKIHLPIEVFSYAIDACMSDTGDEVTDEVIDRLITSQNYQRPIGGWQDGEEPLFDATIKVLSRLIDLSPKRITAVFGNRLNDDNKWQRANTNRVVEVLSKARPSFGLDLLPAVIRSIELDDDPYAGVSADGSAISVVVELLSSRWDETDSIIQKELPRLSEDAQSVLIGVYEKIFRRGDNWREETTVGLDPTSVKNIVARCLALLIDVNQEPGVRRAAAQAIHSAARAGVQEVIAAFEQLLGCLAILVDADHPPAAPPRIILPGSQELHEQEEAMRKQNRATEWIQLRQEVEEIVEELGENNPKNVGEALLSTVVSAGTANRQPFRRRALKLLGKVASRDSDLPLIALPTFMHCLMDYSSSSAAAIRATAIDATIHALRGSRLTVPSDVADVLIIHLHDPYVVVHKAAVEAFRRWHIQLTEKQQSEAFAGLINIWRIYSKNPQEKYFMDDIAESMRQVSRENILMRNAATFLVCEYLPCGEQIIDSKLCELLINQGSDYSSHPKMIAQALIKCLRQYRRDPYRQGYDWREQSSDWISSCTITLWESVREQFSECAFHVAHEDPPEVLLFSSVFCEHAEYAFEAEILRIAALQSNGHSQFHRLADSFERLRQQALACHRELGS